MRLLPLLLLCLVCSSALGQSDAAKEQYRLGDELYDQGKLDEAIARFTAAIRLDPKYVDAYAFRGYIWQFRKDYDKSIADFNEAIRLDPKDAWAYNNRGNAWDDKGEYDKAFPDYNEAIRLDPKSIMAYNNRGLTWGAKGEYDKAIADYNEAVRLDPKNALAYNNRGSTWKDMGEYDKAIADYNEAIRLDPKYAEAYNNRAWLRATCPDVKYRNGAKAIEDATRANELSDWKDAAVLDTLATAYAELGKFDEAIEYQRKAIELETDEDMIGEYVSHLKLYKFRKPYRDEPKK